VQVYRELVAFLRPQPAVVASHFLRTRGGRRLVRSEDGVLLVHYEIENLGSNINGGEAEEADE